MVVVLHGIGSSGEYLGKGIAKFLPPNVKVVGLDRPGLGSWSDSEPVESMAAVLDHMLSILPDLNVPTILLGYSYGSYVAYELGRALRDRGRTPAGFIFGALPPPPVLAQKFEVFHSLLTKFRRNEIQASEIDVGFVRAQSLRTELGLEHVVVQGDSKVIKEGRYSLTDFDVAVATSYVLATTDEFNVQPASFNVPVFGCFNEQDSLCSREDIVSWGKVTTSSFDVLTTGEADHQMFTTKRGQMKLAQVIQQVALSLNLI